MTASGKTVTAPAGYYSAAQTKDVADGALADPTITVSSGGLITAQASVGTAGYLAAGSSKSKTQQLSTQAGKTVTPTNVEQIAVAAGKYVTGDVKVAATLLPTLHIDTKTTTLSVNSATLSFSGLSAEPEIFSVIYEVTTSDRRMTSVVYDGSALEGIASNVLFTNTLSWSYSNGTLTITAGTVAFGSGAPYKLIYGYVA